MTNMDSGNNLFGDNFIDPSRLKWNKHENSRLGTGSFGSVFRGFFDEAEVAFKVFKPPQSSGCETTDEDSEGAYNQCLNELQRLQKVRHPFVVRFYGVSQLPVSKEVLLVTELLEGGSLYDALAEIRNAPGKSGSSLVCLDDQSFVRITTCMVHAVTELHRRGIAHRDLKPQNILLTCPVVVHGNTASFPAHVEVKLADFGCALRLQLDGLPSLARCRASLCEVGTPEFMPPEALHRLQNCEHLPKDCSGEKSRDMYAIGAVMYEVLSLQQINVHGNGVWVKSFEIDRGPSGRVAWGPRGPHIRPEYKAFVEECLRQDPESRPTSANAAAIVSAWKEIAGSGTTLQRDFPHARFCRHLSGNEDNDILPARTSCRDYGLSVRASLGLELDKITYNAQPQIALGVVGSRGLSTFSREHTDLSQSFRPESNHLTVGVSLIRSPSSHGAMTEIHVPYITLSIRVCVSGNCTFRKAMWTGESTRVGRCVLLFWSPPSCLLGCVFFFVTVLVVVFKLSSLL